MKKLTPNLFLFSPSPKPNNPGFCYCCTSYMVGNIVYSGIKLFRILGPFFAKICFTSLRVDKSFVKQSPDFLINLATTKTDFHASYQFYH